jgi:putative FmdB family regulatory protein
MPIYAFECTRCGHRFDRLQRLSDLDPTTCPECGAEGEVRRQLTAPSFRLAGGGWYETDFKKDGKRNLADKGDAPAASSGGEGSASKADAKPAAAGDGKPSSPAPATSPAPKPAPKSDS